MRQDGCAARARGHGFRAFLCIFVSTTALQGAYAYAQDSPPGPGGDGVTVEMLEKIYSELAVQRAQIQAQQQRLDTQEREMARQSELIAAQTQFIRQYSANTPSQTAQPPRAVATPAAASSSARTPQQDVAARPAPVAPGEMRTAAQGRPPEQIDGAESGAAKDGDGLDSNVRPDSERQVDQLLVDVGGVLLPKGTLQYEPSVEYTAISSDRVNVSGFSIFQAIVVGTIRVDDIERQIVNAVGTVRYGLWRRLQIEGRFPAVYRHDVEIAGVGSGSAEERLFDGVGLGDISATVSWQPISPKGWRPAVIFRTTGQFPTGESAFEIKRVKAAEDGPETILAHAPTGSGFYTLTGGATLVWPTDPVVLFAGGNYTYAFRRDFSSEGFGKVDPGNGFDWSMGVNLSLNDRVSTNFTFTDQRRFKSRSGGAFLLGTRADDARLGIGASIALNSRMSLVLSAQTGLTDESPDYVFSARIPITLQKDLYGKIARRF